MVDQDPASFDGQEPIYTAPPPATLEGPPTINREAAMDAFLEAPFLPDASQMRVDHGTALLALLFENPPRSAAIDLVCKSYLEGDAFYIWSQWEPRIRLPPSHPVVEANLASDIIFALLQATYTAPEPANP